MGNSRSLPTDGEPEDPWWSNNRNVNCDSNDKKLASQCPVTTNSGDEGVGTTQLSEEHKEKLNEFKLELARKHEKRRQVMAEKRKEMEDLREEVTKLRKENQQLKEESAAKCGFQENACETERLRKENEKLRYILEEKSKLLETSEHIIYKNRELRTNIAEMQKDLQNLNSKVANFETERQDYKAHVVALKDVIAVSKHMLQIRETQLKELKQKVESIEESLAERETNILSQDLRDEYERQLQNIRSLRTLYEERQTVERREKERLISQLDDVKRELQIEKDKVSELEERIKTIEEDNSKKYDEIKTLESNLGLSKAESRQYQAELAVINQLFSEILLGFNSSQDIDLDKVQKHLEEHHELLQNIFINEISSEVSYALPKVLLDLLNQVNPKDNVAIDEDSKVEGKLETIKEESEPTSSASHQINSAEEIVENLPKVWKILIELLSHQKAPVNNLTDDEEDENPCYKTVQTPKGPSLVLSVSQTFIRLKDLILEKKSLEKETSHLKQLNGHLECRLQDQEKRLGLVQTELSKTWLVVGKLQKQHQMLHTQEKILRYELAQKRKLLTELKEELEYSREKWTQAREKNSNTEQQWKELRIEFASRRTTIINDDLNNSVESGYSDDRECSSEEEPGYETDVSECAQKISGSDDIEDSGKIEEELKTANDSPTLNPIQTECKESDACQTEENGDLLSLDSPKEAIHSDLEQLKTDLVQNNENAEKTLENTNTDLGETASGTSSSRLDEQEQPGTSQNAPKKSLEELLAHRDARLKLLESQAEQLVVKVLKTANKSIVISHKLDDLHEFYGQSADESDRESDSSYSGNEEDGDVFHEETSDNNVINDDNEVPSTDLNVESIYSNEDNQE